MTTMTRATAPESAKILKKTLRDAFPATKFSVRLSRGTGYGSCYISWTDGPTVKVVEEITTPFQGKGFDGMTDCQYYCATEMPDGRQSGLGYVFTSRRISAALARRCAAQVVKYWGGIDAAPEVSEGVSGGFEMAEGHRAIRSDVNLDWYTAIHRAAEDRTLYERGTE